MAFGAFFWIALTRMVWLRHGRMVGMLVRGVSFMHALIASPFLDEFLVLRPGSVSGIKLPHRYWRDLQQTAPTGPCPDWLSDAVRRRWPDLDISGHVLVHTVLVRDDSPYGYGRASYELNLGCNYDCVH